MGESERRNTCCRSTTATRVISSVIAVDLSVGIAIIAYNSN